MSRGNRAFSVLLAGCFTHGVFVATPLPLRCHRCGRPPSKKSSIVCLCLGSLRSAVRMKKRERENETKQFSWGEGRGGAGSAYLQDTDSGLFFFFFLPLKLGLAGKVVRARHCIALLADSVTLCPLPGAASGTATGTVRVWRVLQLIVIAAQAIDGLPKAETTRNWCGQCASCLDDLLLFPPPSVSLQGQCFGVAQTRRRIMPTGYRGGEHMPVSSFLVCPYSPDSLRFRPFA